MKMMGNSFMIWQEENRMKEKIVNQCSEKSIYVEQNDGQIYVDNA